MLQPLLYMTTQSCNNFYMPFWDYHQLALLSGLGPYVSHNICRCPVSLTCIQVLRQPPSTFTPQGHAIRVAPVLLEPIIAFAAHYATNWLLKWRDKTASRKLKASQAKLRKMITELKVNSVGQSQGALQWDGANQKGCVQACDCYITGGVCCRLCKVSSWW
jgi:hypothetical protein